MQIHRNLHNGITFIVTRRCPLQCDHCIMESGAWYREHLSAESMKSWLTEAREFGITRASYSGGDPVLYLEDLAATLIHARSLGMINSLFTSGFWATSVDKGIQVLERLEAVDILGLSTGPYHERFVPLERVANAVVATVSAGLSGVMVQISAFQEAAKDTEARLRDLLPESLRDVPMQRQSIFSAGRAATMLTIPDDERFPLEDIDLSCPSPALTVEPDGLLRGCCSSLLALKKKNPFILGDLREEPLETVLERAGRAEHYQLVRTQGLGAVVATLQEDGFGEAVPKRVANVCDLCFQLYSRPEVARHLEQRFAGRTGGES